MTTTKVVTRTERGWPGHFICASQCMFRRNTLLEYGVTKIVVSTVGAMREYTPETTKKGYETIGHKRYFETMVFHAEYDGTYWDTDVQHQVYFNSPWAISDILFDADGRANDMHEAVVDEITTALINNADYLEKEETPEEEDPCTQSTNSKT